MVFLSIREKSIKMEDLKNLNLINTDQEEFRNKIEVIKLFLEECLYTISKRMLRKSFLFHTD